MICFQNKTPGLVEMVFTKSTRQTSAADISLSVKVILLSAIAWEQSCREDASL